MTGHDAGAGRAGRAGVLDLTRPLDAALPIYADGDYRDPPLTIAPWCAIAARGFRVEAVALGTQTGTHVDAPAHFAAGGATIEAFPLGDAIGRYALIELPADGANAGAAIARAAAAWAGEPILFVRAPDDAPARVDAAALAALLALPPRLWVVAGAVELGAAPPLGFHRALAAAGVFLVEDLAPAPARAVRPGGELAILPLALVGTSGAPCRVIARPRDVVSLAAPGRGV